jgi:hypothetical protein
MKQYNKVKEKRNILHKTKRRKSYWIGHVCLLKHAIEGKRERMGRRARRRKRLLDDLEEKIRYRNLKRKTLDNSARKIRFG